MPIRLGAVSYLNARPLVYGLDEERERFIVRYDVPSKCAELLHANQVDLGLIPSIEYLRGDYRIVPDIAIGSTGPVASVALYSLKPTEDIQSIALDTSSRTSIALLKVLCARWFGIAPGFAEMAPDLPAMLGSCDAALVIGDNALFLDHVALGLEKIDLAEEWIGMTGLPFVFAFWAGRAGVVGPDDVRALQKTRDRGLGATRQIAEEMFPGDPVRAAIAERYLRENIKYPLGESEAAGLQLFYDLAAELGIVPAGGTPRFY
jgi:chorismate dehydratase